MNSSPNSSSSYKNLRMKQKITIKEKMRKDYRNKILNCRDQLLSRFRGPALEVELRDTLNDIYKNLLPTFTNIEDDKPEMSELEEIQSELVEEELEWWLSEHEKSQQDGFDWSAMEQNNDVICPVCQKKNLALTLGVLKCSKCIYDVKTSQSLSEIKTAIFSALDKHSSVCNENVQFSIVQEGEEKHIFLMCYYCSEMQLLV